MIILSSINDRISVTLDSAPVNELDCVLSYKRYPTNNIFPETIAGLTTGVTFAPISNTVSTLEQHVIEYISIYNPNTKEHTVNIYYTDSVSDYVICTAILYTNERLVYSGNEWLVYTATGVIKQQVMSTVTNAVNTVTLGSNVINNNAVANTLQDVTGLSFTATSGVMYKFEFNIFYTAQATTTGSCWSINAPSFDLLTYTSEYSLTATTATRNENQTAVNLPATSNATSLLLNNYANIKGVIKTNSTGVVIARFASEVASSAITALAGSFIEYTAK